MTAWRPRRQIVRLQTDPYQIGLYQTDLYQIGRHQIGRHVQDDNSYKNSALVDDFNRKLKIKSSKLKLDAGKACEQCLPRENIFKSSARNQTRKPGTQHDVLAQRRAILDSRPEIGADRMVNRPLE